MKRTTIYHPATKATAEPRPIRRRTGAGSRTTSSQRAGKGGSTFSEPSPTKLKGRPSRQGHSRPPRSPADLRVTKTNKKKPRQGGLNETIPSRTDCLLGLPIAPLEAADCFHLHHALLAAGDLVGMGSTSEQLLRRPDKKTGDHAPGGSRRARRGVVPQLTQPKPES